VYSILVVGTSDSGGADLEGRLPSVEVLRARGAEDAVEKLARNRRIDAVLILEGAAAARETISAIRDEHPAPPPLFLPVPSGSSPPEGVRGLAPGPAPDLLARIVEQIAS
jgi:vacuolar-type H+-ATPase subunit F/Vma7